jgi:putative ABC transport system permease protein
MKYLPLVLANLWRSPVRSALTVLSVTTAFFLFGMLQGINSGYQAVVDASGLDRLFTDLRVPGGPPMPIAMLPKIEALPGVTRIVGRAVLFGQYQDRKNRIIAVAADVDDFFAVRTEYKVPPDQFARLKATRSGIAMPPDMAQRLGLRLGDKVPVVTQTRGKAPGAWEFDLVALFDNPDDPGKTVFTVINYEYFDALRANHTATVDRIIIRIDDPNRSAQVAAMIDKLFANSPSETRTQNEKEMAASSVQQLGDIAFFTNTVIGAVFFALLFVTGNTMMQSVRERIPEFAVLRTIGFSVRTVFALVVMESLLLNVIAAVAGLLLAAVTFPFIKDTLDIKIFSWTVVAAGFGIAVVLAFVSTLMPAWRISRINIVSALR